MCDVNSGEMRTAETEAGARADWQELSVYLQTSHDPPDSEANTPSPHITHGKVGGPGIVSQCGAPVKFDIKVNITVPWEQLR